MTDQSAKNDFSKIPPFDQEPPPLLDMMMDSGSAGPVSITGHSHQQPLITNDFDAFDSFGKTMDPFESGAFNVGAKSVAANLLLDDFIERERGNPPAPPKFDVQAEINTVNGNTADNHKEEQEDVKQPDDLYLNPYTASKLESNEKFISTDDLIGLSDNESKPENNAFEDCNKEDEIETEVKEPEPIKVEPVRVEPVKVAPVTVEPVKVVEPAVVTKSEEPKQNKPVELLEAEKLFMRFGLDSWFKPETLHPKVESLIYWRDVKKSGVVFGSGLALLLALSYCSLISVFAYVSLLALAGTIAFRIYKNILQAIQKTAEGHPFKDLLELDMTLSQERVQQVTTTAVAHLNAALTELRRLFLVEDLVDSIKFGVLLYCLTYVGAIFNGMTLIILGFIGLFSLPKVYETNKTVIDAQLDVVRGKITEATDKIKAVLPLPGNKKQETEKDK